jgi:hypothetical protein
MADKPLTLLLDANHVMNVGDRIFYLPDNLVNLNIGDGYWLEPLGKDDENVGRTVDSTDSGMVFRPFTDFNELIKSLVTID